MWTSAESSTSVAHSCAAAGRACRQAQPRPRSQLCQRRWHSLLLPAVVETTAARPLHGPSWGQHLPQGQQCRPNRLR